MDAAIFESEETAGQWEGLRILVETKSPDLKTGRSQLEIYLNLEPRAKVGYWTNGTESLALFRRADGSYEAVEGAALPKPTDTLEKPAAKPLAWADLVEPDARTLRARLRRLLDQVAISDTVSTRTDERLNHLCNMLLVKLESDKRAKAAPSRPVLFQPEGTEAATATKIENEYQAMRRAHPAIFAGGANAQIELDRHTIHRVVFELAKVKLMDAPINVVSQAFQVFRSASLKSEEGQYFTPDRIIRSAVAFLDIDYDDQVIDPACGTGGFLLEAFRYVRGKYEHLSDADLRTWAHDKLFGVDKDGINVKLTRAIMQILGDGSAHVYVGDSLRGHRWATDWPHLAEPLADGQYSVVVTNPPFGEALTMKGREAQAAEITLAKESTGSYRDLEVGLVFLERGYRLLAKGGRIGIVLPETYFFSKSYQFIFRWLDGKLILRGMLNIPMEAFQGFCRAKTNFYVFEKV